MVEFWESKFSSGEPLWGFFPADSAIEAVATFKERGLRKILMPGFGYGRNGKLFIENGFGVTGIEIAGSAIETARANGINCMIHHGSVTSMPFDDEVYDGIFCFALIHFLTKTERRRFMEACDRQLREGGMMIFGVTSVSNSMAGTGRYLSRNRYRIPGGLKVYFYDEAAVEKEFAPFGLTRYREIEEPVKFMTGQPPVKMFYIECSKG